MITLNTVPKVYKPYQNLTVCSNLLIGGGYLIAIGKVLPLLVGSGEAPMVWLEAPTDETGNNYVPLVAASVALHPIVRVSRNKDGLTISVGGTPVVHVTQKNTKTALIDLLDLRPIGFNIYGTSTSLIAGGATMSQNTFSGGGTFLALGG
jgi:hypothetical protein